jgi:hypothetical protein
MTVLILMLSSVLACPFYPTIDGQRIELDYTTQYPYDLGISVCPNYDVDLTIVWGNINLELDNYTGTDWKLAYIDSYEPVLFYEDGQYIGQIIPEPVTIITLLFGTLLIRRQRCQKN